MLFGIHSFVLLNKLHFLCEILVDHPVVGFPQPNRAARGLKEGADAPPGAPPRPPGATVLVTYSVTLVLTMVVEVRCVMVGVLRKVILISLVMVLGITVSFTTASLVSSWKS